MTDDFFPNGGLVEHHVEPLARVGPERVVDVDGAVGVGALDAVQQQVHRAQPGGVVDDLPSREQPRAEVARLVGVEVRVVAQDVIERRQEEPAGAAGRVADPHVRARLHHVDHRRDQRPGREVLAGTRLGVGRVLLEQALVGVALHVGVEGHPLLVADQVLDQPLELGRVLDAVLRLAEHDAQQVVGAAEVVEDGDVVRFERLALQVEQRRPVVALGHDPIDAEVASARRPS